MSDLFSKDKRCGAAEKIPATAWSEETTRRCPKEATHTLKMDYEGRVFVSKFCDEHYEAMMLDEEFQL